MQTRSGKVLEPLKKKGPRGWSPWSCYYDNKCYVCGAEWLSRIKSEHCSFMCKYLDEHDGIRPPGYE